MNNPSDKYAEVLNRANKVLESSKKQREILHKIRNRKLLASSFWFLLLLIVVIVFGSFIYANRDDIQTLIKNKTGIDFSNLNFNISTTTETSDTVIESCNGSITLIESGGKIQFSQITVGHCYTIAPEYQSQWATVVNDEDEVKNFAQFIFNNSDDQDTFNVDEIVTKLESSVSTWTLDLTGVQSIVEESSPPSPTAISVDTPEPTAKPTLFSTPQPTLIGQDTTVIDLDQLVINMTAQDIRTVAGEVEYKEGMKWYMFYQDGDTSHYFILDTVDMSQTCITADEKIIISLDPFDQAILTRQVWVLCK